MKFKKLSEAKVLALIAEMQRAAVPDKWDSWHREHIGKEAMIEFPVGYFPVGHKSNRKTRPRFGT